MDPKKHFSKQGEGASPHLLRQDGLLAEHVVEDGLSEPQHGRTYADAERRQSGAARHQSPRAKLVQRTRVRRSGRRTGLVPPPARASSESAR